MGAAVAERPVKPEPVVATTLRFTADQEVLRPALAWAARVSPRSGFELPFTDAVRLTAGTAHSGGLRIDAVGVGSGLRLSQWVDAKVSHAGEAVVSLRFLLRALSAMGPGAVTFAPVAKATTAAELTAGDARVGLQLCNRVEWEPWPEVLANPGVRVPFADGAAFVGAARAAISCAARDDSRPVLTCVQIKGEAGTVTFAGADGFRLARVDLDYPEIPEFEAQIPVAVLSLVAAMAERARAPVWLRLTDEAAVFDTGDARITCNLMPGTFPVYGQLVPDERSTRCTAPVSAWRRAVKLAAIVGIPHMYEIVRLEMSPAGGLVVSAREDGIGSASMRLAAAVEGIENRIALNLGYLRDALAQLSGDVSLEMETPNRQMVFRSTGTPGLLILVMPMFVQW